MDKKTHSEKTRKKGTKAMKNFTIVEYYSRRKILRIARILKITTRKKTAK